VEIVNNAHVDKIIVEGNKTKGIIVSMDSLGNLQMDTVLMGI